MSSSKAYQKLQEVRLQLMQMSKLASMGQLMAGIVHEINNPLNAILGDLYLIKKYLARGQVDPGIFDDACEAAEQLKKVVETCLCYVRDNQEQDQNQPVCLIKAIDAALALLKYSLIKADISVEKTFCPDLPYILGDMSKLEQAYTNLVNNAIQAMPNGGLIKISARPGPEEGQVETVISDSGCGIPAEALPKIFEPFFTTKPLGQGTGLGLAITKGIVVNHRGRIEVDSAPGRGASFTLVFPIHQGVIIPLPERSATGVKERQRFS